MKKILLFLFLFYSVATAADQTPPRSRLAQLEDVEQVLVKSHAPSREIRSRIALAYARLFPVSHRNRILKSADKDSVLELFRAADIAEFYTSSPEYADHMRTAFDSLAEIGFPQNPLRIYEAYISSEQFFKLHDFLKLHPSLNVAPPPMVIGSTVNGRRKIWELNLVSNEMSQQEFSFKKGLTLVVMLQPQCHFSERAAVSLEADTNFIQLTQGRILWLTRIDRNFSIASVKAWNSRHPLFPLTVGSNISDWNEIESWASPGFYFFYDGVLVKSFRGWLNETRKDDLIRYWESYRKLKS